MIYKEEFFNEYNLTEKFLEKFIVGYVESYIGMHSREIYILEIEINGKEITLDGIILDDGVELTEDIFDNMIIRKNIFKQFLDDELEVIIH